MTGEDRRRKEREDYNHASYQQQQHSDHEEGEAELKHQRLVKESTHVQTREETSVIDRSKICPMLLRMFCRLHGHHSLGEFGEGKTPIDDELIVYTWRDASLAELAGLIMETEADEAPPPPAAAEEESSDQQQQSTGQLRRKDARFSFRLIYQDSRSGHFMSRDLGIVYNARATRDDQRTLGELRFLPGDYIDVAILFGPKSIAAPEPLQRERYVRREEYTAHIPPRDPHRQYHRQYAADAGGRYNNNNSNSNAHYPPMSYYHR